MLFSLFYSVQQPGSYWWHAHAGGQYSDGLLGALVLHSPNETYTLAASTATTSSTNTTYDGDLVIPVSDIWHSVSAQWLATYFQPGNADGTFEGAEPVPDSGLVAGYGRGTCDGLPAGTPCDGGQYFNYTLEPNKRYRLRIINVGSIATINVSVDGHVLTVIEADGTEIVPVNVTNLDVAVAQRYSVIIDTNQPAGEYFIRGTLTDDMLSYDNPALNKDQRAILRYSNAPSSTAAPADAAPTIPGNFTGFDATSLKPLHAQDPPNAYKQETLDINFGISQQSDFRAFFNGTSWQAMMSGNSTLLQAFNAAEVNSAYSPPLSQLVITSDQIGAYDVIINNQDEG
jgi:FtsP/CotA-like multicopper oxidase with cupredoxin domain